MKSNLVITIAATTTAPISIKMPESEGYPKMPFAVDEDGKPLETAYIPATTFRGMLRRLCTWPQMEAASKSGAPWSLTKIYETLIGQDAESESAEKINLIALKKRRESNHLLDLFGAGLSLKSRLSVGHFMPLKGQIIRPIKIVGVRKDIDENPEVLDWMNAPDVKKFNERSEVNAERAKCAALEKEIGRKISAAKKRGEDVSDLEKALEVAKAATKKKEEEMGVMKNSSKMITEYEALPAGVQLFSTLTISNPMAKDVTALVNALNLFSQNPILGGQAARGCGGHLQLNVEFRTVDEDLLLTMFVGGHKKATVEWMAAGEEWMRVNEK